MKRLYFELLKEHFSEFRQMVFLAGPRQVGKTTTSLFLKKNAQPVFYFNWDSEKGKNIISTGSPAIIEQVRLEEIKKKKPTLIFDEIHKYGRWKQFLKGFFDLYGDLCHIIITGSAKLNIYKRSGDSLMGRYFLYRIHPLSIGELLRPVPSSKLIQPPKKISKKRLDQLIEYGGFPEPFLKANRRFSSNWQRMRLKQLIKEDVRDLSQIQELSQLEMLAKLLVKCVAHQVSQSFLAKNVQVSIPTIRRWLKTLESFYYCFPIRPWAKNVARSLRKEPKYFLWDWSLVKDIGARHQNFVASHLLKAVHYWTDYGLGEFDLYYIRDKEKREVDFLVTKDEKPWFLVEVKTKEHTSISKWLYTFQNKIQASHAFQVSFEMDFIDQDCFKYDKPIIVPASTFLSQLV